MKKEKVVLFVKWFVSLKLFKLFSLINCFNVFKILVFTLSNGGLSDMLSYNPLFVMYYVD